MAYDRLVYWGKKKKDRPTFDEIGEALRRYINIPDMVTEDKEHSTFFAKLPGAAKNVFSWGSEEVESQMYQPPRDQRWFEVYVNKDYVDVLTRLQDEFTSNVADGFAKAIARRWSGKLDLDE